MSEYIDIYIDTTTKVPEDATEFDHELFERFMSGGPWVAHSEYMKLKTDNAKLRKYVAWLEKWALDHASFGLSADVQFELDMARRELGVEVTDG